MLNKLDIDIQRAQYETVNHPDLAVPVDEFVPKSEHGSVVPVFSANTPELDKKAETAMKIMDEIDDMAKAEQANDYIADIRPLFGFVSDEFIVSGEQPTQHRFDLPTIGNPLELKKEDITDLVMTIFA
jgi:hypothetical protein